MTSSVNQRDGNRKRHPWRGAIACIAMISIAGWTAGGAGCSSSPRLPKGATGDALTDMENNKLAVSSREEAVREAWAAAEVGDDELRALTRERMKTLLFKGGAPEDVRVAAYDSLLSDTSDEGVSDTRNFTRLRLPTEPNWTMVERLSNAAGRNGWQECSGSLVRSWARVVPEQPDDGRPERAALEQLFPGKPMTAIVMSVYADPASHGESQANTAEKIREASWEVLSRIDPTGSQRAELLRTDAALGASPAFADLQKASSELRVIPVTGSELTWVRSLMDADKDAREWMTQTKAALALLDDGRLADLQVRHLEPIRHASVHRPEWLGASRESLLSEARSRMSSRTHHARATGREGGSNRGESLERWESELSWADALTMLVIDDAIREPGVIEEIFQQASRDRVDTSSELGGVLFAPGQSPLGTSATKKAESSADFKAILYPPRDRVRDDRFIASDDMFRQSPRSLCHYHFHVQRERNSEYAGPGDGDIEYASTHGRACLVFTSVNATTLNVDFYQRGGARIDLGELVRGK
jgi:hypothetical protein